MVSQELSQYLKVPVKEVEQLMELRELLLNFEYKVFSSSLEADIPKEALNDLPFYKDSRFMMFSNAQDEVERDQDTDWEDMTNDLQKHLTGHILDFGCGIGSVGMKFLYHSKTRVTFYEPNTYSADFLRHRLNSKGDVYTEDVYTDLKLIPDREYNVIIAWGVFEHLDDRTACRIFNQLLQSLTPDGKLFLKNFYDQEDEYLLHFKKGSGITALFEEHKERIIYARHSH